MPNKKNTTIAQLDERIQSMLQPLQEENAKLLEVNSSLRETNTLFIEKLHTLITHFETLKSGPAPAAPAEEVEAIPTTPPAIPSAIPEETFEVSSNILVLSDSIYRHILSSCPKQPGLHAPIVDKFDLDRKGHHKIHKIIIPGACTGRLWEEAASITDRHSYTNVIVSAGANHAHAQSKEDAADDISDLLLALADLFPNAQIAWSVMLPQPGKVPGIRYVNDIVTSICHDNNIHLIWAMDFSILINGPKHVRSLFAMDGIHLNRKGIEIMTEAVRNYIFTLYKY